MQKVDDNVTIIRTPKAGLPTARRGLPAFLAPIQRYIDSARAQLDVAIAEGQAQAARTRQELEARFAAAKKDPESARSAFK